MQEQLPRPDPKIMFSSFSAGDASMGSDAVPSTMASLPQATSEGHMRVFGRSMAYDLPTGGALGAARCASARESGGTDGHGTTASLVSTSTNQTHTIPALNATCFEAWFDFKGCAVPPGTYWLRVKNRLPVPVPAPWKGQDTVDQGTEGVQRELLIEVLAPSSAPWPNKVFQVDAAPFMGNISLALAAAAESGGGTVQLGARTYRMGDGELIRVPPRTALAGTGTGTGTAGSILLWDRNSVKPIDPLVSMKPGVGSSLRDLQIRSITLTGVAV